MTTKQYEIEGIGKVNLTRRKGSKRISMRIKSDGLVSVNYPWFAGKTEVLKFVMNNADWIKKHQHKVKQVKTYFELNQTVEIKNFTIRIIPIETGKLRGVLNKNEVVITIPSNDEIYSERVQLFIQKIIIEICRKEAKKHLPARVHELSVQHGLIYQKVFIKNLKSKWGSCSSLGNINLNLHLMHLPDHLIDYIILHELSHTKEMNHGPRFWELLNKLTENRARQLDKEMKSQNWLKMFF